VVISHLPIAEASLGASGQRISSKIRVADLLPDLYDLILLSDYHYRQKVAENVYYLGSPLQHGFGETHSPCVWEIRLYKEPPYYKRIAIPTDLPRFVELEIKRPEEARRLFEEHAGDYCQVRIDSGKSIQREFLESEARRAGCAITFGTERAERGLVEPLRRSENIEKVIQEYAESKKLARLGLDLFR